jgi:hypothetical protein
LLFLKFFSVANRKFLEEAPMISVFKFLYFLLNKGRSLIDPNLNPLRHAPSHIKYLATIMLACFWCLAFGLYFRQFQFISYNMVGHIAVVSMGFITWFVFKQSNRVYGPRAGTQEWLRMPDRSSRCDEMTEAQRIANARELDKV